MRVAVHELGGPPDPEAPVLLFSHATGFHGRVWEPMAAPLTDRFHCLALDYRGHGLSELPEGTPMAWAGLGDDALAVLDSLGPGRVVHGVGHSMGGAALALAAARRPDALRSLWLYEPVIVRGEFLFGDGPNPMAEGAARRRARFDSYAQALANFSAKAPLDQLHPDALRSYVYGGFALQDDGSVTLRCRPSVEAAVFQGAASSGAGKIVPELELPVAMVVGREDTSGPAAFAPAVVAALPRGRLIEYPLLGHFGPMEDPVAMAAGLATWVAQCG